MGRNNMIWKRNTIVKINKKLQKKALIQNKHYEKNTVEFKRPLLQIEQNFDKLEKAKHVDKLKTLIHQQVQMKTKFIQRNSSYLSAPTQGSSIDTEAVISIHCIDNEHIVPDDSTNVWYLPQQDAMCFHIDEYIQALTKKKFDTTTSHVQAEFKESYQNYLCSSPDEMITQDLSSNENGAASTKLLTTQIDSINTACGLSTIPVEKQKALLNMIESNQIIVVGTTRDDLIAFTEVPLLLLRYLVTPDYKTTEQETPGFENNEQETSCSKRRKQETHSPIETGQSTTSYTSSSTEPQQNATNCMPGVESTISTPRIVCSTPHFLTAELSAKALTKLIGDPEYAIAELDVGFKRKKSASIVSPPLLYCTNLHLIHHTLEHPSLSQVSHLILDRAHLRDDMFDVMLVYFRTVLAPRRPELRLIILSSPCYMTLLSNQLRVPYFKLSRSNVKKVNPSLYLETILKETGYTPDNSPVSGNIKMMYNNFYKDYHDQLEKHVNLLRLKGTYRADVISNLMNPELEGVHLGLVTTLLTHIVGRGEEEVKKGRSGCVLVFLPHDEAIGRLYEALVTSSEFQPDKCVILKYHSKMMKKHSKYKTFLKEGKSVLILTTEHLEVLDHIHHVTHIVDCGCVEKTDFLPHFNIYVNEMDWVTRQTADERKSWCEKRSTTQFYRMYTSVRGSHLRGFIPSHLGRIRPDHVVYLLKRLGIREVHEFLEHLEFKPQHRSIHLSIKRLQTLQILNAEEFLTPCGFSFTSLPLPPHLARLTLLGCVFSCLDPVLSIVAVLLHGDPFDATLNQSISSLKVKFSRGTPSDHMVWVRVLAWYENLLRSTSPESNPSLQCEPFGLLVDNLALLRRVKGHVHSQLVKTGYVESERGEYGAAACNVNGACEGLLEALVYAGLYPNVAVRRSSQKIVLTKLMQATIHPTSVYHAVTDSSVNNGSSESLTTGTVQSNESFITYSHSYGTDLGSPNETIHLRDVTLVSSMAAILFSHDFHVNPRKPYKFSVTESAYHFQCPSPETVTFLQNLRVSMNQIIEHTIVNRAIVDWRSDSRDVNVLRCVVELLDKRSKLCEVTTLEYNELNVKKKKNKTK